MIITRVIIIKIIITTIIIMIKKIIIYKCLSKNNLKYSCLLVTIEIA